MAFAEMGHAGGRLCRLRQPYRRAHFLGDGLDHFAVMLLVDLDDLAQQRQALFAGRQREGLEGLRAAATALSTSALEPRLMRA